MGLDIRRYLRHWFSIDRRKVLDDAALQRLTQCVARTERSHNGQIRICVEARLPDSYLGRPHAMSKIVRQRAVSQFGKLRVWDTERNNGVLIYLLLVERAIEIVADRGIDRPVDPKAWQGIVEMLAQHLKEGRFEAGLTVAIEEISALLAQHFPRSADDAHANELPDAPHII